MLLCEPFAVGVGSYNPGRGCWIMGYGVRDVVHKCLVVGHGSWIMEHGLWVSHENMLPM